MKEFTLDICGVTYRCIIGNRNEVPIASDSQGECNVYSKTISVVSDLDVSFEEDNCRMKYLMEVIRHEISHAMLYETGLVSEADSEKLPEWLSVNAMKLLEYAEDFAAHSLGVLFDKEEI